MLQVHCCSGFAVPRCAVLAWAVLRCDHPSCAVLCFAMLGCAVVVQAVLCCAGCAVVCTAAMFQSYVMLCWAVLCCASMLQAVFVLLPPVAQSCQTQRLTP